MLKKKLCAAVVCALIACGMVLAGCHGAVAAQKKLTEVKVSEFRGISWCAVYIAQEKGFFAEPIELAVADVSFISLDKILPPLKDHLAPNADCVFLIKPQFEVGRDFVCDGKVKDQTARAEAIERVVALACGMGYRFVEGVDSDTPGAKKGNVEYLARFCLA